MESERNQIYNEFCACERYKSLSHNMFCVMDFITDLRLGEDMKHARISYVLRLYWVSTSCCYKFFNVFFCFLYETMIECHA